MKNLITIALLVMSVSAFAGTDRDAIIEELNSGIEIGTVYGWYDDCNGNIHRSDGVILKYDVEAERTKTASDVTVIGSEHH